MNTAELHRQIQNMLRIGTIADVDLPARCCRVQIGPLLTGWLNMPADIGHNYRRWRPLRIGTQVLLASPGGDLAAGVIVAMLFSQDQDAPANADTLDLVEFDDGTQLQYNSASHTLTIHSTGPVEINCTTATVDCSGNASLSATRSVDVSAGTTATITASAITLQDGSAGGVVCQSHVCAFTGSPHPQASTTITGGN